MRNLLMILGSVLLFPANLSAQAWAKDILASSIGYHDPEGNWEQFSGAFTIEVTSKDKPSFTREVIIDLPQEYFELIETRGDDIKTYRIDKGVYAAKDSLTQARTLKLRDYHTYLYGLPMKLKDPGAQIDPKTERVIFHGRESIRMRVTYDPSVGSDNWYFYFNPENYALIAYQFYHNEAIGDGEYILLEELESVEGIKMPKIRSWYYNNDGSYIGTDELLSGRDSSNR
jgi:hypothetical protein